MYTCPWCHWITLFYTYRFFGWTFESTYASLKSRRFANRGFLRLPMLSLYGTGTVMMLRFSLPVKNNLFLVYLVGVIAAALLEYAIGHVMGWLFKMKYWDYSSQPFDLRGYICLSSSVTWGSLTIFLTDVIHKPIVSMVPDSNPIVEFTFIGIVSMLFVSDFVKSTKEALGLGHVLEAMTKMKSKLEEVQVQLALLKTETTQRMAELRDGATPQASASLGDTMQQMGFSLEDVIDSPEGITQKISDSLFGAVSRVAGMKEETAQRVTDMKEETYQRTADMKEKATFRVVEATQKLRGRSEREDALSDRIKSLTENRQCLSHQMFSYRKSLLCGNPLLSSSKFTEALKEFKESVNNLKK